MEVVDLFKALGDKNRLRIINLLMQEELCVGELEELLDLTQSNVSRHLTRLKQAGVIISVKEAQWVRYSISQEFKQKNNLLFTLVKHELQNSKQCDIDMKRLKEYQKKIVKHTENNEVDDYLL